MRGRKPTPTALKVLRGNPGKRPINDREPQFDGLPERPSWLMAEARRVWDRVAPVLVATGVAKSVDVWILAAFCEAVADFRWATEEVRKRGRYVRTPNGHRMVSPALTIKRQAAKQIATLGAELGLTPAARTRIVVEAPKQGSRIRELREKARG